jgi:hypothetical protein
MVRFASASRAVALKTAAVWAGVAHASVPSVAGGGQQLAGGTGPGWFAFSVAAQGVGADAQGHLTKNVATATLCSR